MRVYLVATGIVNLSKSVAAGPGFKGLNASASPRDHQENIKIDNIYLQLNAFPQKHSPLRMKIPWGEQQPQELRPSGRQVGKSALILSRSRLQFKMSQPESVFWAYAKPFLVGSLSGSAASTVIQPIDTIKVVIQNKREAAGKTVVNLSPFFVGREIVQANGVIGLYKGLDSAILRQFVYCGIRLGLFKVLEDRVKKNEKRTLTFGEKIAYSLFTGAVGSVIANPTDMALIRFQSDNNLPAAERRNYKNVFDALGRIYKEEGVKGLWRGSIPTIARAMVVNCSHLVGYNESKEQIMKFTGEKKETMTIRLTASAISGIAVSLCSLPFDNVKTKILKMRQNAAGEMPYRGFIDCFAKSIKNEGVSGLWVGLPTFYSRMAPHAMITVLLQDLFHDLLSAKKAAH